MSDVKLERVKGTVDYLPPEQMLREEIFQKLTQIANKYGFLPMDTPILEKWETLAGKSGGGSEIKKETYNFKDQGGRQIGMRFDLTVPSARVLAMNPKMPMPFKRYQYGKIYRYQEIKPGRNREFYQFDMDTYGTESIVADAECIAMGIEAFKLFGFKEFNIRVNNRKLLKGLMGYAGVDSKKIKTALVAIDKLDKIGIPGVQKELENRGINKNSINKISKIIKIQGTDDVLNQVEELVPGNEGIKELRELIKYLNAMKIRSGYSIDLSLVRGLEYYTGTIFEISAKGLNVSFAGGGRYDKMIENFIGTKIPAVGISYGIEPIYQVLVKKRGLKKTRTQVYIVPINEKVMKKSLGLASELRALGVNTEIDLKNRNLSKNIEYANKKGIKKLIIVGERDVKEKKVTIKNIVTGKERRIEFKMTIINKAIKN